MNIPEKVMDEFKKEAQSIKYGKVSLGIILKEGNQLFFEIDKHITLKDNGDIADSSQEEKNTSPKMGADENSKVVFNENNDDSKL
jgi:hypothetical protein